MPEETTAEARRRQRRRRMTIGDILKERGWATDPQLDECAEAARNEGSVIGAMLVDRAYIINEGTLLMEGAPSDIVSHDEVRRVYLGERFQL